MAGKRNIRLKSSGDVAHFLARLINEVRRGEVDVASAGRQAYMANILLAAFRNDKIPNTDIHIYPPAKNIELSWQEPSGYTESSNGDNSALDGIKNSTESY